MKNLGVLFVVVMAVLAMGSCGSSTKPVPFDNGDSADIVNADPTVYGVCGEETAMNTLQLITDMGDTLSFDISEAQENEQVFGGLHVGDRLAVLPAKDRKTAEKVINQAALLGNWVMPNPIDGSDEVGICIKEGGIAESIAQSNRIGGSEEDETNIYDIVKLGPDTLVYKDVEETFEYSRQKPKEDYGGNIKLEDAEDEFFM